MDCLRGCLATLSVLLVRIALLEYSKIHEKAYTFIVVCEFGVFQNVLCDACIRAIPTRVIHHNLIRMRKYRDVTDRLFTGWLCAERSIIKSLILNSTTLGLKGIYLCEAKFNIIMPCVIILL